MTQTISVRESPASPESQIEAPTDPCLMVIFGASGDLTKRLLMPALYNLACDRLLPQRFAIIGTAQDKWTTDDFRKQMSEDIEEFNTRDGVDQTIWANLAKRFYYVPGNFGDLDSYKRLADLVAQVTSENRIGGNTIFYMAVPPFLFGTISINLEKAGFRNEDTGWKRIIVEKPFGTDLPSAIQLNKEMLTYWREDQIYRIDHYLGKETVQNIVAFRFSNGLFEPLWNNHYVDHMQFSVSESVSVEGRGKYYETAGALRDMIQNHMFQMMAYVCMEPPVSMRADAVRDEKAKLLEAVRIMSPTDVSTNTVRGQYGEGRKPDGTRADGYRQDKTVDPKSNTETFAAIKLEIDNWRWKGVPIYLRSGKSLWKRGTEIVVQFKKAPEVLFRDTPVCNIDGNRLIFHIQPDQGIELRFNAKIPGPSMRLQKVNMRFNYDDAFRASRGTGYEVLLNSCMHGDATLFSRTDFVETAWRIAQPMLDQWKAKPAEDFPNYAFGSWGPMAAFELIERDQREWLEVINRNSLQKVPLFRACEPVFLNSLAMALKPTVCRAKDYLIRRGDTGKDMYLISRGKMEVIGTLGEHLSTLTEGDVVGEIALLLASERTADVRALTDCDLYVLDRADFASVLRDHPQFAKQISEVAKDRYKITVSAERLAGTWTHPG